MDTWLSQLVMNWAIRWYICQAVFCDWSLEIGQVGISRWRSADTWGSRVPASPGVASSLDSVFFTSGCWSRCLLSDADVPSSDCDFFHFFTALCSVRLLDRCVLSSLIWLRLLSFNHVACAVYMIVLLCVLLVFCRMAVILILRFHFCFYMLLQSLDYSVTLPVTVFRFYVSVSLLLLTVVLFL